MNRKRRISALTAIASAGMVAAALAVVPPAAAAPVALSVTTLADSGAGSLRAALLAANAAPDGGTITFAVAGAITLASDLPQVSKPTSIDATTAPGYAPGGAPVVQVDFNGRRGLYLGAGSDASALLGLSLTRASGDAVTLISSGNTLNNNYIGLTPAGTVAGNAGSGVRAMSTSTGNLLGLNSSGASGAVANVISGNTANGIVLDGSTGNTVVSNRIGTDPAGTAKVPNGADGITLIRGANGNTIGGTLFTDSATGKTNNPTGSKGKVPPVFVVPPLGNVISGNTGRGVSIKSSERNVLNGNFIGTTADGDSALGNGSDGVALDQAHRTKLKGCKFRNEPFVYYNVVAANGRNGLHVTDSDDVKVQANFFGVAADNTTLLGNKRDGILVDGTSENTKVGGVIPLGNVSAGNGRNGIEVRDQVSGFITFNTFGGLLAFKGAAPNGRNGLLISSTGGDNLARTNVFSGNKRNGIALRGQAQDVTIDPNIVGATTNGQNPLPNGGDGLVISGRAHDNTIGGTRSSVIPQNTFSGNEGFGIRITGRARDNTITNTFVGTKIFGNSALANESGGILLNGKVRDNVIGGKGAKPVNIVSGNDGPGIRLDRGTKKNTVKKNAVGIGSRGDRVPNSGPAIVDRGSKNTVKNNETSP